MDVRDRALIRAWLAGMAETDRAVARLLMEGYSIREAARRLGRSYRETARSVRRLRLRIGKDAA
jgi:transposase